MGISERSLPGKENSKYKTLSQEQSLIYSRCKKVMKVEEGDAQIMKSLERSLYSI